MPMTRKLFRIVPSLAGGNASATFTKSRADLVFCYRILHGFVNIDSSSMFVLIGPDSTRGHCWKLKCVKPNLNTCRYFFAYRTDKAWNKLNSSTVCATSINIFKSKLAWI